jgi:hypothetical protein
MLREYAFHYNAVIAACLVGNLVALEDRTARLTILIDPRKKALFERLCAEEDATPSQVVRRLVRRYIEERTGQPWTPPEQVVRKRAVKSASARRARRL